MNFHLTRLRGKSVWIAAIGFACLIPLSHADEAGEKAVRETRQKLRKEGFKTDLADFDFSTSPELRAREAILRDAVVEPTTNSTSGAFSVAEQKRDRNAAVRFVNYLNLNPPDLMETVGSNSVAVVWELVLPEKPPEKRLMPYPQGHILYSWEDLDKAIAPKRVRLDRATAAILAGPIRFDLTRPASRRPPFPHVILLKTLEGLYDNQLILALHYGNMASAWTNLLAATQLATAWDPEPPQACHLARFDITEHAFEATWQAIQTNSWSDAQLARLQKEWESVDFFTGLPETAAYERARQTANLQWRRIGPDLKVPLGEFMAWALRFPVLTWELLRDGWREKQYLQHGSYVDEVNVMWNSRADELKLRRAVQAPMWLEMRRIPTQSHPPPFNFLKSENKFLLENAAVAEAQRRILITALALERYRTRNGNYPPALSVLAPEFLRKPAVDFMDGQPLRYRINEDGHFIIYSVGLNCVDGGGQSLPRMRQCPGAGSLEIDTSVIIWPLAASVAEVESARADVTARRALRAGPGQR